MTNDPIDAHVEKMESVVMDVCTDKDKSQMKPELKPQKMLEREPEKAEIKSHPYIKVVLAGIFFLSLCADVGSLASSLASKETCVTGEGLLTEGQEVPALKTTERRRLDADDYYPSLCTQPPPVLKKCAVAPNGMEPWRCWELADPEMTDIPVSFLSGNTDLTGTLKLGAAVETIGEAAFYGTMLTGLDLSNATSLVSIGDHAFGNTDITGTLVIPANVETIGDSAFYNSKLTSLDLSDATSLVSIGGNAFQSRLGSNAFDHTRLTGTLVIPAKVETIGEGAFLETKLTGLDLSNAASLVSIGFYAFYRTDITGTLVIPAKVETIGEGAFNYNKLTVLDLSQAASLVSIGDGAFGRTDITGPIVTPFNVPTYTTGGSTASFPPGVWIVKVPKEPADPTTAEPSIVPTIEWPNAFPTGGSIVKGSSP